MAFADWGLCVYGGHNLNGGAFELECCIGPWGAEQTMGERKKKINGQINMSSHLTAKASAVHVARAVNLKFKLKVRVAANAWDSQLGHIFRVSHFTDRTT